MKLPVLLLFIAFFFQANSQVVIKSNKGYELIDDIDGEILTKYAYPFIDKKSGKLHLTYFGDNFGYINDNGTVILGNKYEIAYPFKGEFALVGNYGNYFYINKKGQKFGRLSWPKAPNVFKDFLIVNGKTSYVFHKEGDTVLTSKHQLITSKHSGILEWNKDSSTVKQYSKGPKYGTLRKANTIQKVDTVALTWQGYACIERNGKFDMYNDRGDLLFENLPRQNYYLPVKIIWHNYLYLPDQHNRRNFENEIHYEPLYDASKLHTRDGRNVYGPSFLIGEGFQKEDVALLKGTNKWVLIGGHEVINGFYMFDEVLPSDDDDFLLTRKDTTWFAYIKDKDSIIPLKFRYIHPRGLVNGQFFGSREQGPLKDKHWSHNILKYDFSDLILKQSQEFQYTFPKSYYQKSPLVSHPSIFEDTEEEEIVYLEKGKQEVIFNKKGDLIYQANKSTIEHITIDELFMPKFFLKKDTYRITDSNAFKNHELGVYLKAQNQRLEVIVANRSSKEFLVALYNDYNLAEVYLEYQKRDGTWQRFTQFPGDLYTDLPSYARLLPNHKMTQTIQLTKGPDGPIQNVRAKLVVGDGQVLYSNSIPMSLCPAMLYGNPYFGRYGAITKYQLHTKLD